MSTSIFIEQLAAGHAADAKETLSNLLSARAFESLDARKKRPLIARSAATEHPYSRVHRALTQFVGPRPLKWNS